MFTSYHAPGSHCCWSCWSYWSCWSCDPCCAVFLLSDQRSCLVEILIGHFSAEDCGIDPGVQVICRPSCLVTCVLEVFRDPCAAVSGLGACGEDCGYERVEASALSHEVDCVVAAWVHCVPVVLYQVVSEVLCQVVFGPCQPYLALGSCDEAEAHPVHEEAICEMAIQRIGSPMHYHLFVRCSFSPLLSEPLDVSRNQYKQSRAAG